MHLDIQTFPASAFGVETADFCFFYLIVLGDVVCGSGALHYMCFPLST